MKVSWALISAASAALLLSGAPASFPDPDGTHAASEASPSDDASPGRATEKLDPSALPGYREVNALAAAYPGRIDRAEVRDGEWAVVMDDNWYYWEGGRLLPYHHRGVAEQFVGIRFYGYEPGPLREREITPELDARLRERTENAGSDGRLRFNGFLDALYGISSFGEAEGTVVRVEFLGNRTRVHPMVVGPLAAVERRIKEAARGDSAVAEFVEGLAAVHAYNWRNIAGTLRRSYHSYGIAVDLLPQSFQGQWAYWRWAMESGVEDWWQIPLSDRWQIPQIVIDAFEDAGFVWGGKWLSFDDMHFEYRPESMIIAAQSQQS